MKKAKKITKPVKLGVYKLHIYPIYVWVTTLTNLPKVSEQFYSYNELSDAENQIRYMINPATFGSNTDQGTYLVSHRETGQMGALIVINERHGKYNPSTIAHESAHIADLVYEYIDAKTQNFTGTNEPYTYLLQYIFRCIHNYIVNNTKLKQELDEYSTI